jgi:23S rRNA (adenine2503-C2)-methyltransferase
MESEACPGQRPNLVGMTRAELADEMAGFGAEPFRARQLWHWIYHRGATDFGVKTNLAKPFRERLAAHYELRRPEISRALVSSDATRKWLLRFDDGQEIETVHIPESDRGTLCVSSQVGCTLNCTFCHTGTQRLVRNLTAAEIVAQVMVARDALGEWPSPKDDRQLTNIVLMGMGEPLHNYDETMRALRILADTHGLAISPRRITLSTVGLLPALERLALEPVMPNLAISLHAPTDVQRGELVPGAAGAGAQAAYKGAPRGGYRDLVRCRVQPYCRRRPDWPDIEPPRIGQFHLLHPRAGSRSVYPPQRHGQHPQCQPSDRSAHDSGQPPLLGSGNARGRLPF